MFEENLDSLESQFLERDFSMTDRELIEWMKENNDWGEDD